MAVAWTEEKIAVLKRMWAESASGEKIGTALGISRNAVLSKVRRLDLPMRAPGRSHPGIRSKMPGSKGGTPQAARAAAVAASALSRKPVITLASGITGSLKLDRASIDKIAIWFGAPATTPEASAFGPRTILDLGRRHCRYPLFSGQEPIDQKFYCGEPKFDGSYCMHHAPLCAGIGMLAERLAHLEAVE
ncbi:GcrA family cell cycle regulator [Labrys sp. La1]|uniref:GcrA family cell cycle regulator n=1 Tax=Labrys sp. La1 TaxID=3404917 RepID=UPI003EB6B146